MSKNQQQGQRSGAGQAPRKAEASDVIRLKFKCSVELIPGGKVYRPDNGPEGNGVHSFTKEDAEAIEKAGNTKYLEALIADGSVEFVEHKAEPEAAAVTGGGKISAADAVAAANKANVANSPGMTEEQKLAGEAAQKAADATSALLQGGKEAQAAQADAAKKD